jgi:hypothetical protein
MNLVWQNAPYQEGTLLVLLALADWSDDDGKSFPSIPKLSIKARQSERNIRYALKRLEKDGVVAIKRAVGRGNQSTYQINLAKLRQMPAVGIKGENIAGFRGGRKPAKSNRENLQSRTENLQSRTSPSFVMNHHDNHHGNTSSSGDDAKVSQMLSHDGGQADAKQERACRSLLKRFPAEPVERFLACYDDAVSQILPPGQKRTRERWREVFLGWRTVETYFPQWLKLNPASSSNGRDDWRSATRKIISGLNCDVMTDTELKHVVGLLDEIDEGRGDFAVFKALLESPELPAGLREKCLAVADGRVGGAKR